MSAPFVTATSSGLKSVAPLTGDADQDRHTSQWHTIIAIGSPLISTSTSPQKHLPLKFAMTSLPVL